MTIPRLQCRDKKFLKQILNAAEVQSKGLAPLPAIAMASACQPP
jgi:hypothetical protein